MLSRCHVALNMKDLIGESSLVADFLIEKKGKVWRFNDWGLRKLAYKIKKAKKAHYFLMNFELEAKWINDFKTMLDKEERVIRHLVIKRDKAETKDCPPPPEFHTLRSGMDDVEEEEDDVDYDDEEYAEDEMEGYEGDDDAVAEDWVDEDEMDDYDEGNAAEDGLIVVTTDVEKRVDTYTKSSGGSVDRRQNQRAEKAGR